MGHLEMHAMQQQHMASFGLATAGVASAGRVFSAGDYADDGPFLTGGVDFGDDSLDDDGELGSNALDWATCGDSCAAFWREAWEHVVELVLVCCPHPLHPRPQGIRLGVGVGNSSSPP